MCSSALQPVKIVLLENLSSAQLDDDWNTYHLFVEAMRRRAAKVRACCACWDARILCLWDWLVCWACAEATAPLWHAS